LRDHFHYRTGADSDIVFDSSDEILTLAVKVYEKIQWSVYISREHMYMLRENYDVFGTTLPSHDLVPYLFPRRSQGFPFNET
jgi:hypothetical protein